MTTTPAFRGFRFPAEVILWAVRWYLRPCRGPWHVDETYIRVSGE